MNDKNVIGFDLNEKFLCLLNRWKNQIAKTSSGTTGTIYNLPSYKEIIKLGIKVIPCILKEFKKSLKKGKKPDLLFAALIKITGEQPIKPYHIGDLSEMAKSWIKWGRSKGVVN